MCTCCCTCHATQWVIQGQQDINAMIVGLCTRARPRLSGDRDLHQEGGGGAHEPNFFLRFVLTATCAHMQ